MKRQTTYGTDNWVEQISQHELPALVSTVKILEKMETDETSSLALLGQLVLHDHSLTSRILKVVNSVHYRRGRYPITTVSRAAVILGFNNLKHICLTARMIDSLLENRDMSEEVYQRLLKLMARSFHAAMLAKMMLSDYSQETQEEVYIATLLHKMGEIAFWSMGGEITAELDEQLSKANGHTEEVIQSLLGTNFHSMGSGLARTWNMGPMLIKSFSQPEQRSIELRCVKLAHQLSEALGEREFASQRKIINDVSNLIKSSPKQLKQRVEQCSEQTEKLLSFYGAADLKPYLNSSCEADSEASEERAESELSRAQLQLDLLREMTQVAIEKPDINLLFHTLMEGVQRGIGLSRVVVILTSHSQEWGQARFVTSENIEADKRAFRIPLKGPQNVFGQVYQQHKSVWVDDQQNLDFRDLITQSIARMTNEAPFFAAPIVIDQRCIAIIYADRAADKRPLKAEDFQSFEHFVSQANLCISLLMKNAGKV